MAIVPSPARSQSKKTHRSQSTKLCRSDLCSLQERFAFRETGKQGEETVVPPSTRHGPRPNLQCVSEQHYCPLQDGFFVPGIGCKEFAIEVNCTVLQDLATFTLPGAI